MAKSGMTVRLTSRIPELRGSMRRKASAAVRSTAFDIKAGIQADMSGPKTGLLYGDHQASAPGEAPAVDTGMLFNSIQVELVSDLTAHITTDKEYAPILEFGGVNVAPRPSFEPNTEEQRPVFLGKMKQVLSGR